MIFNFCLRCPESELCICVLKCIQDRFVELYLVVTADLGGESSWEKSTFSSLPECSGKFKCYYPELNIIENECTQTLILRFIDLNKTFLFIIKFICCLSCRVKVTIILQPSKSNQIEH